MAGYFFVLVVGLFAGCLTGVVGSGAGMILLPVLVFQFGPQQAVPIMAIASLMSNVAKLLAWRNEVNWRAFLGFSVTAVPAVMLGARTLLVLPPNIAAAALGVFFLLMIPARRWLRARNFRIDLWQLAAAGAVIGFITGLAISTGPISIPIFAAYGLSKGALLSTEALSSLGASVSKIVTFREAGALPAPIILKGLIVGLSMAIGAFSAKAIVRRLSGERFDLLLDLLMVFAGLSLLASAFR